MKTLLILTLVIVSANCIENLMNTDIQKCINCLCHAKTGCYSRFNCAQYSIHIDYWKKANSPVVNESDDPDSNDSFTKCMGNENCIVNTIKTYTESFGELDCNCDGQFDCKDRFAIHLHGANCVNPTYGKMYASRFNQCARSIGVPNMLPEEGSEGCTVEPV